MGEGVLRWVRLLVLVVICVQIPLSVHYGLDGASVMYNRDTRSAHVLRNINHLSNLEVRGTFLFGPPRYIREQAATLERHNLSVFAQG